MRSVYILCLCMILLASCTNPTTTPAPRTPQPTSTTAIQTKAQATITPTPKPIVLTGCVDTSGLNVRSAPGTDSDIVGGLTRGDCVSVLGRNDDTSWVYISNDALSGWVSSNYLNIEGDINALNIASETTASKIKSTPPPTNAIGAIATYPYTDVNGLTLSAMQQQADRLTKQAAIKNSPSQPEYILCGNTQNSIGSYITCKIPRAYCEYRPSTSGSPTFCNDARYPNNNFTMLVWDSNWSDLDGQCIIISGQVERYSGKLQIVVDSRSQVSACP